MSGDDSGGPGSRLSNLKGLRGSESTGRVTWSVFLSLSLLLAALAGVGLSLRSLVRRARSQNARPRMAFGGALACIVIVTSLGAAFSIASSVGRMSASARASGGHVPLYNPASPSDPIFTSAFQFGGTGTTQVGGRAVDSNGNIYVTGGFTGTITLNTTPQTTLTSTQDYDFFIAKFDPAGNPLWARAANGATGIKAGLSLDGGLAVAVDPFGNAYAGGGFVSQLNFKDANGATVKTLGASGTDINFELFVAKYDADGNLVWAQGGQSGAKDATPDEQDLDSGINGITDIVVDKSGNLFVGGTFSGTNFLGKTVTTAGLNDALVARLSPSTGSVSWVSVVGSADHDNVLGLGVDGNSNVYVTGDMEGSITFPTKPNATTLQVDPDESDTFLAKYNSSGQVLWAKEIGGTQDIEAHHVAVDSTGQIYLTGLFQGTSQFDSITVTDDAESLNGFLAKYTTDGSALWVRSWGKSENGGATGEHVALDAKGNPFVIGLFSGDATFAEETPLPRTIESDGDEDQFVLGYNAAGNFKFLKQISGSGEESENTIKSNDVPVDISLAGIVFNDATGTLQVTGDFQGTLGLDSLSLDSGTDRHAYVATLTPPQQPAASSAVEFSASDYQIGEGGGSIEITVLREGDVSGTSKVDYATSDGTASQKSDYEPAVGTLTFNPGDTSKTFRVLIVDDTLVEGDETINLTLSNPVNAELGDNDVAALTIKDNDTTSSSSNPIDSASFFVRQHYLDFLNREPDASGFQFWTNNITSCGADANCTAVKRVNTSAAFFLSIEFQQTGVLAYLANKAAFGPAASGSPAPVLYAQFERDVQQLQQNLVFGQPGFDGQLEVNKQAYFSDFVARPDFAAKYPTTMTPAQYVDALYANAGVTPSTTDRNAAINEFGAGSDTSDQAARARALRDVAQNAAFAQAEFNRAFVTMEYFGYLRRDPDTSGFNFWLGKLNQFNGNYLNAEMVKAFITSTEYRQRFGQ
jgi:hypothetical protein